MTRCLGEPGGELIALIGRAVSAANDGESTEMFADSLGLTKGVTGYTYHSVPVVIHAWLTHPHDFRSAVGAVIGCGGDTDSTAAMIGGIVGAAVGKDGIPPEWLNGILEWPRSVAWMERVGRQLAEAMDTKSAARPIELPFWGLLPRNLFFLLVVLFHGFRRLAPPY